MNEVKKIQIKEKGSREFYQEVINVSSQYRKLLRRPEAKLVNQFQAFRKYMLLCGIILVILIVEALLWGGSAFTWFLIALLVILGIEGFFMLCLYNRRLSACLNEHVLAELTLDDDGIAMTKNAVMVKLSWEHVAFVRLFHESVCFIPKKRKGVLIAVDRRYYDEISEYIRADIVGDRS